MIAVITGDIINSQRQESTTDWMDCLKMALAFNAKDASQYHIYRGDSFQLEVPNINQALLKAIHIKASIRSIKNMDVRIAIGIGEKSYSGESVAENQGTAYVRSGHLLEQLKKKTLSIHSPWSELDDPINTMLTLSTQVMDRWTPKTAETVQKTIELEGDNQTVIAKSLQIPQSKVSERLSRAGYEGIREMEAYYTQTISRLL